MSPKSSSESCRSLGPVAKVELAKEELQSVDQRLHQRNLELSRANNDLNNLLSSTNIPVVMVGGDLRIRRFTAPAENALRLSPPDVGRPIEEIAAAALVPNLKELIGAVIEDAQPRELEIVDRNGRYHELRIHPYRTADQHIDGAVIVLVDIDRRKRAEEALRESDRRKDEFLATLAHELRSPLAPLYNIVETLRRAGDDHELRAEAHDVLYRQLRHLSRIVADVIDVSRIVEKKVELKRERVDLASVVENALESCRSMIVGKQHRLRVTLPVEPIVVHADPGRLAQILINLLNNAAKYTEPGGSIDVTAELGRDPPLAGAAASAATKPNAVIVHVHDTGIGIGADLMPRIFDMFTQGTQDSESGGGGLGVGLALARSLAQMHGGDLIALSPGSGGGSEFILRVPLAGEPAAQSSAEPASGEALPKRILVVDDNHDQAETLGQLLEIMGHDVRVAFDGPTALEVAASFAPDVALIDIGMPGLSGYEVARLLRQKPQHQGMKLIAQTGWGQSEDRRRSREAGFDHHLIKPIDVETLLRLLALTKPAAPRPGPSS